jgi:tRNA threonylcarbamoyl adenosine modification protein YeaZ
VLVLVLDCATPAVTAALARISSGAPSDPALGAGVEILAKRRTIDGRAHGELLAPHIAEVLAAAGVRPHQLAAVVAGLGPGPFTGLRVGLVTAAALTQALGIAGYGVCTLDAFAYGQPGRLLVATDARRREIYWAQYADGARVSGPAVDAPAEVATLTTVTRAVGDGALRYADVLGIPVVAEPRYPPVAALAALAADRIRAAAPGEPLTPLYLRRPDVAAPGERKAVLP